MAYQTIVSMAGDQNLLYRVAACAAEQDAAQPLAWAQNHMWHVVNASDWQQAWDYATQQAIPDAGKDPGVITDQMILSAVQGRILETRPTPV